MIVVAGVVAVMLSVPNSVARAENMSVEQLQAQIASLLATVQNLQRQLAALQGGAAPSFCHTFSTNLRIGDQNDEVTKLYSALINEGLFDKDEAFQDGRQVLNFDERLASAVSEFQEKYASEILTPNGLKRGTGYAGPSTRAKLNRLYGCKKPPIPPPIACTQDAFQCSDGTFVSRVAPSCKFAECTGTVPVLPSITVLSPNGGETYRIESGGSPITVNWKTNNVPLSKILDVIRLRAYSNGQEYNLATNVLNDGQEVVILPLVPVGAYTLEMKTYINDILVTDGSDSYFKVIDSTNTQPTVTVLVPNGGESYYNLKNENGLIGHSVKVANVTTEGKLSVYLVKSKADTESSGWFLSSEPFSPSSSRFITEGTEYAGNFPVGTYYILGVWTDISGVRIADYSDYPFTIATPMSSGIQPMTISDIKAINAVTPQTTANLSFGVKEVNAQYNLGSYHSGTWHEGMNPGMSGPVWVEFGWPNSPAVDVELLDQNNVARKVYLPATGADTSTYSWYYWIAEDGSSYYAHTSHGSGWPNLTYQEALVPAHLARQAGASPTTVVRYPGFYIQFSKTSYLPTEDVIATVSRADGNTASYLVDTYIMRDQNAPLQKNVAIAQGTQITFRMDQQASTYKGPGQYALLLCDGGKVCDGGVTTNSATFTITSPTTSTQPTVTVLVPNGGEAIPQSTTVGVRWTSPNAGLLFSMFLVDSSNPTRQWRLNDGTAGYTGVNVTNVDLTGGAFVVSDSAELSQSIAPGSYLLKVCELVLSYPTRQYKNCDSSNAPFTITAPTTPPSITVLSPNGGEAYKPGDAVHISWRVSGSVGANDTFGVIVYNYPSKTSVPFSTTVTSDAGNASWTIPLDLKNFERYTAYVVHNATGYNDESNSYFTITSAPTTPPSITVLSPNGGETYNPNQSLPVSWSSTGSQTNAYIYLKRILANGASGSSCYIGGSGSASTRSFDRPISTLLGYQCLNIPDTLTAGQYKVQVMLSSGTPTQAINDIIAGNGNSVADESNAPFTIAAPTVQPSITVLSPNGGEVYSPSNPLLPIKIEVKDFPLGGTLNFYFQREKSAVYDAVPRYPIGGAVGLNLNPHIESRTVNVFADGINPMVSAGQYYILAEWQGTDGKIVTNYSSGQITIANAQTVSCGGIFPTLNNYTTIGSQTYRSGSSQATTWAYVANNPGACQYSCANGGINNGTACSAPTAGKPLACGQKGDINGDGVISSADYDLLGQVVVGNITSTLEKADINGNGVISTTDWVALGRYVNGLDSTFASCVVAVQPSITVLSPNGGEALTEGQPYRITWNTTGTIQRVALEWVNVLGPSAYSKNNIVILENNPGYYNWTPKLVSPTLPANGNYKIEVYDRDNLGFFDQSNSTFTVTPIALPVGKPLACGSLGDLNNDGVLSDADYSIILNFYMGVTTPTDAQIQVADLNRSGTITLADTILMNSYLAGKITTFAACNPNL